MLASREFMQVRGSQLFAYTKDGGGGLRSTVIRAFTMTDRLTGHPCNDKGIVGAPEDTGPAKGTGGSHLPVAPDKLVSPQSMHTQTNINMRGSH